MDNNPQSSPTSAIALLAMWLLTAASNFLAFTKTITLDDVQKIAATTASIVVIVITILTFLRSQKKKR
ncbi:MAG: hypothetical protein IPM69_14920 [Ignavibacteria bacterium]|nr:hypothetical protein [Ignavibacteria bacterium]